MKPYSIFVFLFLMVCCTTTEKQEGLLWKISGNGLKAPSYLLGTFHSTYDILYNFTDSIPNFRTIFEEVEQYVGESIDYNIVKEMEIEELLALFPYNSIFLPPDTTYNDLLSPDELQILDSLATELMGINAEKITFAPGLLSIYLSSMEQEKAFIKHSGSPGKVQHLKKEIMDLRLQEIAREKGYEVHGLEAHLDVMRMLLKPQDLTKSIQQLVYNLKTDSPEWSSQLVAAYRLQNINRIPQFEETKKKIQQERILAWMQKIPTLIYNKPTLIGVEVRHLPGETGLISLLRNAGYIVESI